jgi:hypothetical protein
LDAAVAEILLPPMTRLAVVVTGFTGPQDVRRRLLLAEDGRLSEAEAVWLGSELDALARLLAR